MPEYMIQAEALAPIWPEVYVVADSAEEAEEIGLNSLERDWPEAQDFIITDVKEIK